MASLRDEILHIAGTTRVYDPEARRRRYLRERELMGRKTSIGDRPASAPTTEQPIRPGSKPPKDRPWANPNDGPAPKPTKQHTPVTPARVAALKVRLEQLRELLTKLAEQAKIDAGGESTKTTEKKTAEPTKPEKKKTAAEKKEEAKKAKETRAKESPTPAPETASSVQAQIDSVLNQIADMRAKLAAARKAAPKKKPAPKPTPWADKGTKPNNVNSPTAPEGRHH
jgi:hypothetical protein